MKIIQTLFISLLLSSTLYSQGAKQAQIDKYFQVLADYDRFSGSVVLMKGGKIIYHKSIGKASREKGVNITDLSLFQIGSISKTYTATLILQAVEEGKLSLNDKLDKYFPTIPHASDISIQHMLTHRSGINNFTNDSNYLKYNTNPISRVQMVDYLASLEPEFTPNETMSYSNAGFVLLSYILEDVYGMSYNDILQQKICKPLGLKQTAFGIMPDAHQSGTSSYTYSNPWTIQMPTHPTITMGAGGIYASTSDVGKFAQGLFAGKLLSPSSLDAMTKMKDGIGMGIFSFPFADKKFYGHTGGIDGYHSVFGYNTSDSAGFVILANAINCNMNDIGIALLSHHYGMPITVPEFSDYKVTEAELLPYIGVYENKDFDITFHITQKGATLYGRIEGQQEISIEATALHTFESSLVGAKLVFTPDKGELLLLQNGMEIVFLKK